MPQPFEHGCAYSQSLPVDALRRPPADSRSGPASRPAASPAYPRIAGYRIRDERHVPPHVGGGAGSGDDGKVVTYDNSIKEFVASYLSLNNFGVNFKGVNFTETYITSGQLLTSNTTPITLLSASGSLTEVEVPIMFVLRYKYGTTAYTTNTTIDIEYTGPASTELITSKNCLGFTVTGIDFLPPAAVGTPHVRITPNYSLQLSTRTGNPAAGDGDLIVYTYSITLNI